MIRAGESPFLNVAPVRNPHKAIREAAKYIAKAASPKRGRLLRGERGEFTDPVLAARIEVALSGVRLLQCYGEWRGVEKETDLPDETPKQNACSTCGATGMWRPVRLFLDEWLARAPADWIPRFGREGPGGSEFRARNAGRRR
jgi:hypothetical protein